MAVSGGIGPLAALPSGDAPASTVGEHPGTTAAVAGRSDGASAGGGLEARRESSSLFPQFLSGPSGRDGSGEGQAGSLAPAVTATFASVRGAYPGSLVVLSAAQQRALQERHGVSSGSSEEIPASVHRGAVPDLGVVLDHPVAGPVHLSSPFGWRINPTRVGPAVQFHIGQDYPVACGTPVHAAADGTVRFAADRGTSGLRVDIDHGGGLASAYHHNSALLVSPGDTVVRGDVIALAGTTGNSTGCHVHFGITLDGRSLDPALVLPAVAGQPAALSAEELERLRQEARTVTAPTPPARAAGPRDDGRPSSDSGSARERPVTEPPSKQSKQSTPSTPASKPTARPTATPAPRPTAQPTSRPTAPERPTPKPTAPPNTAPVPVPAPSTPAPSTTVPPATATAPPTPTPTAPTDPTPTPTPSPTPTTPTPEPSGPTGPAPTPEPTPTPPTLAPGAPTDPEDPAPPAPPVLTEQEAARWCVALDPEDLEGDAVVITAETVLTEIIAVLDAQGAPELVDQDLLTEVDPATAWLESLPRCSDEDFLAAAAIAD